MNDGRGAHEGEGPRLQLARKLLLEALHRARALTGDLGPAPPDEPAPEAPGADRELTAHGRELLYTLWPQPVAPSRLRRVQGVVRRYVDGAQALARRRDRFLHDFRTGHGFDSAAYTAGEAAELAGALGEMEAEAGQRLQTAARELLGSEAT